MSYSTDFYDRCNVQRMKYTHHPPEIRRETDKAGRISGISDVLLSIRPNIFTK